MPLLLWGDMRFPPVTLNHTNLSVLPKWVPLRGTGPRRLSASVYFGLELSIHGNSESIGAHTAGALKGKGLGGGARQSRHRRCRKSQTGSLQIRRETSQGL